MSGDAPIARNSGSMTIQPAKASTDIRPPIRRMLWMPKRRMSRRSPAPALRAITEEAPMPTPKAMLVKIMVMGKVKVTAATCSVESCPMKPISKVCTRMLEETPSIMGAVSR